MPDGSDVRGPGTDLIPRATLEALLGHRDRALALAAEARALRRRQVDELDAMLKATQDAVSGATSGQAHLYKLDDYVKDRYRDEAEFTAKVRHDLDAAIWPSILAVTGLGGLMDKQARDEFERQLSSDPPECTADNIRATFRQLRDDAHRIFRRGLVNVFKNLSREYRSHDGFKLGPRTIVTYAVSTYGTAGDYHTLADADRIMHILDGMKVGPGWNSPLASGLCRAVRSDWKRDQRGNLGDLVPIPGELTTRYWRIKWFQNRNAHLWCLRPDLLRRANRLIAEHFGEAVGEGPDAAGARRYTRAKPHHHDVEDFYETRPEAVARIVRAAALNPGLDVLEPSAGSGAIAVGIWEATGSWPDCIEIDSDRAEALRERAPPGAVVEMDFLAMHPEPEYDRILMNPPWGKGAGVQHVHHALRFLKPGGRLVAVLGPGLLDRQDGPTIELRKLMEAWPCSVTMLPPRSFVGTATGAALIVMDKPGATAPRLPAPGAQESLL